MAEYNYDTIHHEIIKIRSIYHLLALKYSSKNKISCREWITSGVFKSCITFATFFMSVGR